MIALKNKFLLAIDWPNIKARLLVLQKSTAAWIVLFCFLAAMAWSFSSNNHNSAAHAAASGDSEKPFFADTFIPKGFVLIPIEVANSEGLDAVLGEKGVVDLFTTEANGKKGHFPIARKVKVLRSPADPRIFSVLTPESRAGEILKYPGPFHIAVQNPKESEMHFESKPKRNSRISFESF